MAVLVFRLRGVPDDEAQEVRDLLSRSGIEWYETSAGLLGISLPGIWIRDDAELNKARRLIEDYQHEKTSAVRAEYAALKRAGKARRLRDVILEDPLRVLLYLLAAGVVGYLSIAPFMGLW
jgi:hypothetical protein